MTYSFISAADFAALMQADPTLDILDIRSKLEYEAYHLDYPVQHTPLHEVEPGNICAERSESSKPLYVLCKMGPRAEKLCQLMETYGQDDMIVIQGGIMGCKECGASCVKAQEQPSGEEIQAAVQDSVEKFIEKFSG